MTQNQIKYQELLENKRHNLATEDIDRLKLGETGRHNLITEAQGTRSIDESIRHNLVTESLTRGNLDEAVRHNTVLEGETIRSNIARETETHRSNVAAESIAWSQLAETSKHNRETEFLSAANLVNEQYKAQTDRLKQEETARHNVEQENIDWANYNRNLQGQVETQRHNEMTEQIQLITGIANSASNVVSTVGGLVSKFH